MQTQIESKIVSIYQVRDNGMSGSNRKVWATIKFPDMSIEDLIYFLTICEESFMEDSFLWEKMLENKNRPQAKCIDDCSYGCSFGINASDEESLAEKLKERDAYIDELASETYNYEARADNRFNNYMAAEIEYDHDYSSSDWGNDVDGIVMYVDGREVYRSFPDFHEVIIPL